MRPERIALTSALLLGCAGEITFGTVEETFDDAHALSVVLEGAELENELLRSPVREAPVPFSRIGLIWDADLTAEIEISTSVDGERWSDWQAVRVLDVEVEGASEAPQDLTAEGEDAAAAGTPSGGTSLIGLYEAGDERAFYYRVRASSGDLPTFLTMDFLEFGISESIEDGMDASAATIGSISQGLTVGDANVNPRSAWNASPPRCVSNTTPSRITIHHTVTPTNDSMSPQARLRQIQSYHMNVLGWCDIGYNFLVSRDGRLWEGRGATRLGTHTGGANTGNVGISVIGTYTSTSLTDKQRNRTARLIRGLSDQYGIALNANKIKGHRDFNQTACPGDRIYADLGELIRRAKNSSGDTSPPPPPPSDGTTVKGIIFRGNDTSRRLAGATVKLGSRTTTTNDSGYYEFRNVGAGSKKITASKSGFETKSITRDVSGNEVWGSMGLSREAAGDATVVGVIYKGSNSADRIGGATITLSNGKTTTADANGYYEIANLPAGDYEISASASGHGTSSVTRTLSNGTKTWGSISL